MSLPTPHRNLSTNVGEFNLISDRCGDHFDWNYEAYGGTRDKGKNGRGTPLHDPSIMS